MTEISEAPELAHVEVVDDAPFFAPVTSDVIDGLLGQYQAYRARIDRLARLVYTEHEWSRVFEGEFSGTSVSVVVPAAQREES